MEKETPQKAERKSRRLRSKTPPGEEELTERRAWLRRWEANDGRFVQCSLRRAAHQVSSRQWNSIDTMQETGIVLYKQFPPNNKRKAWTSLEEGVEVFTKIQMASNCEKAPCKKQTNKLWGRNTKSYQSSSSTLLSGRFLAASALTSKA